MTLTATTRVLALLGSPIAHSASPELQNAAFRKARVNGVYVAVRCGAEDIGGFMRGLARAGGGGNVTLPHKEAAARILDVRSDAVRKTGACNTFWGDDAGRLHGGADLKSRQEHGGPREAQQARLVGLRRAREGEEWGVVGLIKAGNT